MFVVFCHESDGSKSVPFVEPNTREAFVAFVGSIDNDVFVVFAFWSDDIGGSYTSCVVPKELRRRAKMAMMSNSMLEATEEWVQAPRVFIGSFNRGKIWGSVCVDHARDTSHIGMRKYTWSIHVSQLLNPPDQNLAKPKADHPGADDKLLRWHVAVACT